MKNLIKFIKLQLLLEKRAHLSCGDLIGYLLLTHTPNLLGVSWSLPCFRVLYITTRDHKETEWERDWVKMSSSSSARLNHIHLRRISLNADNPTNQQNIPGRHLRRIREPIYLRKYSDRTFTHTRLRGIKSSQSDYNEESGSISGSWVD